MNAGYISRRYARALIDLTKEQGTVEAVYKDLASFHELLGRSAELTTLMQSKSYTRDQREAVIKGLLSPLVEKGQVQTTTLNFLLLLARRDRIRFFEDIFREFNQLRDDLAGIIRIHISSATELPGEVEVQLEARLKDLAGKNVILTKDVDPSLIGGIVTKIGNVVLDGSLATQFNRFRAHMEQSEL